MKAYENQLRQISMDILARLHLVPNERLERLLKRAPSVNGFITAFLPETLIHNLASLRHPYNDVKIGIVVMENENGCRTHLHEAADMYYVPLTRPKFLGPVRAEMYARGKADDQWFPIKETDRFYVPAGTPHGFRAPARGLLNLLMLQSSSTPMTRILEDIPTPDQKVQEAATP